MQNSYLYIGCFFDSSKLNDVTLPFERTRLFRTIEHPHITFAYRPKEVDETLFGSKIHARLTAYGNDGKREGAKAELWAKSFALQVMIERIALPHITLSVSEGERPFSTRLLQFEPISPVEICGVFGGYTEEGKLILQPPMRG